MGQVSDTLGGRCPEIFTQRLATKIQWKIVSSTVSSCILSSRITLNVDSYENSERYQIAMNHRLYVDIRSRQISYFDNRTHYTISQSMV